MGLAQRLLQELFLFLVNLIARCYMDNWIKVEHGGRYHEMNKRWQSILILSILAV
jgi:hypothetical protein